MENTWAAGGEAGRHHACKEQGKSWYKVGYGCTWGYILIVQAAWGLYRAPILMFRPDFSRSHIFCTLHITSSNYSSLSTAKVGYGYTWGYSCLYWGHQYLCPAQIFHGHITLPYITLHITSSNYSSSSNTNTHYKIFYPHYHICSSCNAITQYNIILISTLSSPHLVMPLRYTKSYL